MREMIDRVTVTLTTICIGERIKFGPARKIQDFFVNLPVRKYKLRATKRALHPITLPFVPARAGHENETFRAKRGKKIVRGVR